MHFVAALDRNPRMRCVLGLSEGVVTGAADGYARMTGKPAATLLHLGPGLANGLANLHNARRANSPIINVVGDHAGYHLPLDAPLTSDIESLARPMSHWVGRASDAALIREVAAEAWSQAVSTPGIATLILPADAAWGNAGQQRATPSRQPQPAALDISRMGEAARALFAPEGVAILLGGARLAGACPGACRQDRGGDRCPHLRRDGKCAHGTWCRPRACGPYSVSRRPSGRVPRGCADADPGGARNRPSPSSPIPASLAGLPGPIVVSSRSRAGGTISRRYWRNWPNGSARAMPSRRCRPMRRMTSRRFRTDPSRRPRSRASWRQRCRTARSSAMNR
jgi:hypothetical protein